jgi:hypothetical protein
MHPESLETGALSGFSGPAALTYGYLGVATVCGSPPPRFGPQPQSGAIQWRGLVPNRKNHRTATG